MNAQPSRRYRLAAPTMTVTVSRGDLEIEVELLWTPGEREIRWGDNARPGSDSEIDVVAATIDGQPVDLTSREIDAAKEAADERARDSFVERDE